MNHRKSSDALDKADVRAAALGQISPALDLGRGLSLKAFGSLIAEGRAALFAYNGKLTEAEGLRTHLTALEKRVRALSKAMLKGVAAHFGEDSDEYALAGAVRESARQRPHHEPKKEG